MSLLLQKSVTWEIDTLKNLRLIILVKDRNITCTNKLVEKHRRGEGPPERTAPEQGAENLTVFSLRMCKEENAGNGATEK